MKISTHLIVFLGLIIVGSCINARGKHLIAQNQDPEPEKKSFKDSIKPSSGIVTDLDQSEKSPQPEDLSKGYSAILVLA
jgi:hypothetical protein